MRKCFTIYLIVYLICTFLKENKDIYFLKPSEDCLHDEIHHLFSIKIDKAFEYMTPRFKWLYCFAKYCWQQIQQL